MSLVLVVCEKKSLSDIISLNLKIYLGINVICRDSIQDAKLVLSIIPEIKGVICQHSIGGEKVAEVISEELKTKEIAPCFVVLGSNQEFSNSMISIEDLYGWREALKYLTRYLSISGVKFSDSLIPDFIEVDVDQIINLHKVPADFYIRIVRKDDVPKFVMRLKQGDPIDKEALYEYMDKGIGKIFVKKSDRMTFCKTITEQISDILLNTKLSSKEKLTLTQDLQENLHNLIEQIGFTKETVKATRVAIDTMSGLAEKEKNLSFWYKNVCENPKMKVAYSKAQLTTLFATGMVNEQKWSSGDVQSSKLAMVAFFCDMTLKDENLALVRNHEELDYGGYDEEQVNSVLRHASQASSILARFPKCPMGVVDIVREHHGVKNGFGFSTSIDPRIGQLSVLFMIAEEMAVKFLKHSMNSKGAVPSDEFYNEIMEQYKNNQTRNMLKSLKKVLSIA